MEIEVRLATAQDRRALDRFYNREGLDFQSLSGTGKLGASRDVKETMYVIAIAADDVVAALKLDIFDDPRIGLTGLIQHFEIEDELERTDLGLRMIQEVVVLAEERGLRALDTVVPEDRRDVISIFEELGFEEFCREVCLRRELRISPFR
ncbi:MAG: hypothetical protein DRO93_03680 [Candidatus Thorarchaeota archaeon]|nr:MAG: hypothetical protein DRO93_03680 [Candidatus Thorarchaeota archaeon]